MCEYLKQYYLGCDIKNVNWCNFAYVYCVAYYSLYIYCGACLTCVLFIINTL